MLPDLLDLLAYNRWANARMLDAVEALDAEQFARTLEGSFPSVRETVVHILKAEWAWLARWQGSVGGPVPELGACATPAEVRARWAEMTAAQSAFLASVSDGTLDQMVDIRTWSGITARLPLAETIRHVVNHSTYHRGQVTIFMRRVGAVPAGTDLFLWQVERAASRAAASAGPVSFRSNNEIAIHVPDLAAAERFYGGVLGFRLVSQTNDQLVYETGALHLYITRDPTTTISYIPSLNVADRAAADRHLREAGTPTVGAGEQGTITYYTDPFGMVFDIVERP